MALNETVLSGQIFKLLSEMRTKTDNADQVFSDKLAGIIDAYIKTAVVSTTVTCTVAGVAGVGTGTGGLS